MTEDQEKLLRRAVDRWDARTPGGFISVDKLAEEVAAIASVLLELRSQQSTPEPTKGAHPLRLQMEHAVTDIVGLVPNRAAVLVDNLLDVLDQDPGHDATAAVIEPMKDRSQALEHYRGIIQAIRRGD